MISPEYLSSISSSTADCRRLITGSRLKNDCSSNGRLVVPPRASAALSLISMPLHAGLLDLLDVVERRRVLTLRIP